MKPGSLAERVSWSSFVLVAVLGSAIFVHANNGSVNAASNGKTDVSVRISSTCSIVAEGTEHTGKIAPGASGNIGADSTFTITCNDPDGYVVYAVGAGKGADGVEAEGNTDLVGVNTSGRIATGTANSGGISNWYFSLSNPSGLTINSGFDENVAIPNVRTAVASKVSGTSAAGGDSFTAKYSAYISSTQVADTYSGKVNYVLFHPSSADAEGKIPAPKTMQEFGDYCDSMTTDETLKLTDSRDNTQYTIAKLKDGKCWMIDNLRIGSNSGTTSLNSSTSDVASSFTLPKGETAAGTASGTTGWHWQQYNTAHIYIDSNTNYGGYYTWYAATAGEGTSSMSSGNTSHSICPKGWTLPSSDQITALTSQYDKTTKNSNPPNFGIYPGYCDETGCPRDQGSRGRWWSSTAYDSDLAYLLYANSSTFRRDDFNKGYGYSVRCVAR